MLLNKLLSRDDAYSLWVRFGDAIGSDELKRSYGEYWPRRQLADELVWEWADFKELVGWSAARKDPLEPVFWAIIGIFPDKKGNGYAKRIFRETIDMGFNLFPTDWCFAAVSKKCGKVFPYMKEGSGWVKVGEMNVPEPGYLIFGLEKSNFQKGNLNG
jgi:hypothetical protein